MHLHLIRHTTPHIASGVCYGQSDIAVADSFHAECDSIKAKLLQTQFDAVYTSPLQRCSKLATALNLGEAIVDERLQELHFGDWEMQAWDAISRDIFDTWANDYVHGAPPNGESFTQLHQRTKGFIEEVGSHSQGKNIAIITHSGVIRALLAEALSIPLATTFSIAIDCGGVTQIAFNGHAPHILCVNR